MAAVLDEKENVVCELQQVVDNENVVGSKNGTPVFEIFQIERHNFKSFRFVGGGYGRVWVGFPGPRMIR